MCQNPSKWPTVAHRINAAILLLFDHPIQQWTTTTGNVAPVSTTVDETTVTVVAVSTTTADTTTKSFFTDVLLLCTPTIPVATRCRYAGATV